MKNFVVTDKDSGKQYWISRAMAVAGVIFAINPRTQKPIFLVEKRGPGCPDYIGYYALVCGYLDWDETLEEAIIREAWEETGLRIDPERDKIEPFYIQDNPKENTRQNVTVRFAIEVPYNTLVRCYNDKTLNGNTEKRGGEAGEIEKIELVELKDLNKYKWAWNHDKVIEYVVQYYSLGE